jgi:flavin reductase (DIM6/NTAB) family NADH-FMN oxidoreductase RutF
MIHDDLHSYEPRLGHGLPHDPFNAIVGPRPIGWVSTRSAAGQVNLAPYSFFNAFNYVPPIVGFASVGRKDSLSNIEETGEFVWNLATRPLADAMNASCVAAPRGVNEFELAGLTQVPTLRVAPPRVGESPVAFECKLSQLVRLQGADGQAVDTWLVLGEVVQIHIARTLLVNGIYDTAAGQPILRGGGPADYFGLGEKFLMRRPR